MAAKGYKRHNPRACKKKARGGVGSRSLFKKKAPHVSTPVSAGLRTLPSEGSLPCITPLPMKPRDVILQLKRKVNDMESQALKWNDRLIELEVFVKQKDSVIEKHIKRTRLMNEEISNHKKAHNLVSSILGLSPSLVYHAQCHIIVPVINQVLYSQLQEHEKRKTDTYDRVHAERNHWAGVLFKSQEKYEHILIEKDVEIASIITSKDTIIDKLRQDSEILKQSLNDQKEDAQCLLFAHRESQRDLRDRMGKIIESKKIIIKNLRAKIVDQEEMCQEMVDEVNGHKKAATLMKKRADDAAKLSIARHQKNKSATDKIRNLKDQLALLRDKVTTLHMASDENESRIKDLEEENMDLMETIHVSDEHAVCLFALLKY